MTTSGEVSRKAFENFESPLIAYGRSFPEICRKYVEQTFKVSRTYVLVGRTLANQTPALKQLQEALGDKIVGTRVGMTPHTLFSECLQVIHECRRLDADFIIVLGAGSLADAGKLVAFALGNNVKNEEELMKLPYNRPEVAEGFNPPKFPFICIPTSLSGGEYSDFAGATRDSDHCKVQFSPPLSGPKLVVLDPELALFTPIHMWLSTGVRSIDHCTETLCGLRRVDVVDRACSEGLKNLIPGLLNSKKDPSDSQARFSCMLGTNLAMTPLKYLVVPGASHGIGHNLGPLGVGHGETSCILLPAVCKHNAKRGANVEQQAAAIKVFWSIPEAESVFKARGLEQGSADLGDLLDAVFRELGMPRNLGDFGIGRDKFDLLSKNSLEDVCTKGNPAPLDEGNVREILEACL